MKRIGRKDCARTFATKPVGSFSPLPTWIVSLTNPKVLPHMAAYIHAVAKDFFLLQFLRKLKILHIPILNVETHLDKKVPFTPRYLDDYLGFVNFWIRPLAMLVKTLGVRKAAPYLAEFFMLLKRSYKRKKKIYRFCMTTTNRPAYNGRTYFAILRVLDPHYLCVPSLHIAVVSLCYAFFRDVLRKEDFPEERRKSWTREIYDGAIKIAETVLYVKQHSVNCIPAALYMMTKITPRTFADDDALKFLDDMFVARSDISPVTRGKITSYMKGLFSLFYEEGATCDEWTYPIRNWMKEYALKTAQTVLLDKSLQSE